MIFHDLSPEAVRRMVRVDLATVTEEPASPIGTFEFHGCTVGVASFSGKPPWELHTEGDELLHILGGESELTVLEDAGPVTRLLRSGDIAVVPQGCWHSGNAPDGVVMLYQTPSAGNRHSWDDPRDEHA
jgi:uncharacterized cupin superfamily protein